MISALIIFQSIHDTVTTPSGKVWFSSDGLPAITGKKLGNFLATVEMVTARFRGPRKFNTMSALTTAFICSQYSALNGPWVTETTNPESFDYVYTVTWRYTSSDVYAQMVSPQQSHSIGNIYISVNGGKEMDVDEFVEFCNSF